MFDFFEPTSPFAAQTLRLVAEAQQGGGDLFGIARCARRIEAGDKESWGANGWRWHARPKHAPGKRRPLATD